MKLFMKIYNQKHYIQRISNPEKHNSNVYETLFKVQIKIQNNKK